MAMRLYHVAVNADDEAIKDETLGKIVEAVGEITGGEVYRAWGQGASYKPGERPMLQQAP